MWLGHYCCSVFRCAISKVTCWNNLFIELGELKNFPVWFDQIWSRTAEECKMLPHPYNRCGYWINARLIGKYLPSRQMRSDTISIVDGFDTGSTSVRTCVMRHAVHPHKMAVGVDMLFKRERNGRTCSFKRKNVLSYDEYRSSYWYC